MNPSLLMAIAFASIVVFCVGIVLVFRSLFLGWRRRAEPRISLTDTRLSHGADEIRRRGFIRRLDVAFDQLVAQTGLNLSSAAALLWLLLAGALVGSLVFIVTESIPAALISATFGMLLPLFYFHYCRAQRFRLLESQLPRVLNLLARAVRAGESVDGALHIAGASGPQPLATEFDRCAKQLDMGLSMTAAMRALTYRLPLLEVRILAAALTLERKTGGNIAVVLDRAAAVVRDRHNYRQQFRALTAGGRLSLMLAMLCIPAYLLFILIYQSEWGLAFFNDTVGLLMFVTACMLLALGLFWAARILKTNY